MADGVGPLTGVILAGGRAERMGGRDKGLLALAGEPLIAHAIRRLQPQVADVMISANRNLEAYRRFGCRVVQDDEPERHQGPLAGILAAMRATGTPYVLTAPCDSPILPPDYARRMIAALERERAALAVASWGGFLQPVFALLPVALRDDLASYLATGDGNTGRWLCQHQPARAEFPDQLAPFRNVNTPEDLSSLETGWLIAGKSSPVEDPKRG
jgi:molybdopterin-guanine dinucleotide biosynthesis protein A